MRHWLLFLSFLMCTLATSAQYCSLQEGRKLYYAVSDGENESEAYTLVSDVTERNDSCFITLSDWIPQLSGQMKDSLFTSQVVYANGCTLIYLQDEDSEKQNINAMLAGMLSEKELAKAQEELSVEGQICLLLNGEVEKGDKMAPCKQTMHVGPLSITTSLKGKYAGIETVSVPAGEFECIKVVYTLKSKMLLFSDTVEITEWYAKGIGLIKQEEVNKKSDRKKIKQLKRVEKVG